MMQMTDEYFPAEIDPHGAAFTVMQPAWGN
jgi:hypothetical protein